MDRRGCVPLRGVPALRRAVRADLFPCVEEVCGTARVSLRPRTPEGGSEEALSWLSRGFLGGSRHLRQRSKPPPPCLGGCPVPSERVASSPVESTRFLGWGIQGQALRRAVRACGDHQSGSGGPRVLWAFSPSFGPCWGPRTRTSLEPNPVPPEPDRGQAWQPQRSGSVVRRCGWRPQPGTEVGRPGGMGEPGPWTKAPPENSSRLCRWPFVVQNGLCPVDGR